MSREMKHSGIPWIGDIPNHWELKRLQSQVVEINEKNYPIKTDYVLSLTVKDGVIPYDEKGDVGNKSKENHAEYKLAYPNTIVLNSMNILIGAVGISKYFGCVSPVYYIFKSADSADLRYLNYIMSSTPFQKYLRKYANGILEIRLRVSSEDILKRHIPVPPLSEQKAIADYLDKHCAEVDEMVSLQEKIIEELRAYRQAIITETVTHGLNPNAPMKDSGVEWIGQIPEGWVICKLKRQLTLLNGRAYSDNELLSEGKYKILRVGNLFTNDKWYYSDLELESDKYCVTNDLLYGWSASIGPYIWKEEKVIYHYHIWKVLYQPNILHYVYYLLDALTNAKRKDMHGSAMQHLTKDNMDNSLLVFPPLPEQQVIADYLDKKTMEIDQLITIKQQKIEELKEYKKSLIYEYVTGKKEVDG